MGNPLWVQIATDVLLAAMTGVIGLYVWLARKSQVNAGHIEDLATEVHSQIRDQSERLSRIEAVMEYSPDRADLKRIHSRIDKSQECLARMEGEFRGVVRTVNLIHEYLMSRDKK